MKLHPEAVDIDAEPLGHTDWVMFLTAALTGLRQSELLGLQWRDVDFAAERVRVRRSYVRGHWGPLKSRHSSRSVPMAPQVAAALRRHLDRSQYRDREDLVFGHPHTGKVLSYSAIDRRFKKTLRAAKVREVRFHDLRHTFGTRLAANGVPPRDLQEWMDTRTSGRHRSTPPTNRGSTRSKLSTKRSPKRGSTLNPRPASRDRQYPDRRARPPARDPDPR